MRLLPLLPFNWSKRTLFSSVPFGQKEIKSQSKSRSSGWFKVDRKDSNTLGKKDSSSLFSNFPLKYGPCIFSKSLENSEAQWRVLTGSQAGVCEMKTKRSLQKQDWICLRQNGPKETTSAYSSLTVSVF